MTTPNSPLAANPVRNHFTYDKFIEFLIQSIDQIMEMSAEGKEADSVEFRSWKVELNKALKEIKRQGYEPECNLLGRFELSPGFVPGHIERENFVRDRTNTMIEMRAIIDWHFKWGEPGRRGKSNVGLTLPTPLIATPLLPPEKITLPWIVNHMTLGGWGTVIAAVAAIFTFGMWIGGKTEKTISNDAIKPAVTVPVPVTVPTPK